MSAADSVGLVESLASMAFIWLGQLFAKASEVVARAMAAMMNFIRVSRLRQENADSKS